MGILTAGGIRSDDLAETVKAHDFHAHRTCPSRLHLVLVTEEIHSRSPSPVVQVVLDQHTEQRTLSSINCCSHGLLVLSSIERQEVSSSPLPTTAILVSMTSSILPGILRMRIFPLQLLSLVGLVAVLSASSLPPTLVVRSRWQSAPTRFAASTSLVYA